MNKNKSKRTLGNIPELHLGKTEIEQISRSDYKKLKETAIKEWHFEKGVKGVIPVAGKFDPYNPKHIKISDVLRIYIGGTT